MVIKLQDCIEGMRELAPESIDIVVTSPPYNLDIKYGTYQDGKPRQEYLSWLGDVFVEIKRVLKPNGHFFLNVGYSNLDPWVGHDVAGEARKLMILQNNFTWVKSIAIDNKQVGHYKPINSERFANPTWEHIFHFTKTGDVKCNKEAIGVPYSYESNIDNSSRVRGRMIKKLGYLNKRDFEARASKTEIAKVDADLAAKMSKQKPRSAVHCPGNVWYIPYETIADRSAHRGSHPATFPVELARRAIKFSDATGTLLDPFMGTGTSAVAAKELGLEWVGFDIDPQYVAYAESRLTPGDDLAIEE